MPVTADRVAQAIEWRRRRGADVDQRFGPEPLRRQ
jgi:hypothetical protein